jgi:hypothetical protein
MPKHASRWMAALLLTTIAACARESVAPSTQADVAAAEDAERVAIGVAGTFFDAAGPMGALGATATGIGAPMTGPLMGTSGPRGGTGAPPGMNVTVTTTFYDAAGAVQAKYDALTTAKIVQKETVSGTTTVQRDGRSVVTTVQRSGETTITGLEGRETSHTINGSASGTVTTDATADGKTSHAVTTSSEKTADLVIPVPGGRDVYPKSGTLTHERTVTLSRAGGTPVTHAVKEVTTFDGTAIAKVTITVDGQTRTCTRNLATRQTNCT